MDVVEWQRLATPGTSLRCWKRPAANATGKLQLNSRKGLALLQAERALFMAESTLGNLDLPPAKASSAPVSISGA